MRLRRKDLDKIVASLSEDVRNFIKENPVYLAGGFIRSVLNNEEIKDIDLFTHDSVKASELSVELAESAGYNITVTENAHTVNYPQAPVQFIHRWVFDNAYSLIASFDFTIAQAAVWFEDGEWHSIAASSFYDDLGAKSLRYTFPYREEEPGGSLLRVLKFLRRGYDISPENLAKVIARLMNGVNLEKFEEENEYGRAEMISDLLTPAYKGTNDDE